MVHALRPTGFDLCLVFRPALTCPLFLFSVPVPANLPSVIATPQYACLLIPSTFTCLSSPGLIKLSPPATHLLCHVCPVTQSCVLADKPVKPPAESMFCTFGSAAQPALNTMIHFVCLGFLIVKCLVWPPVADHSCNVQITTTSRYSIIRRRVTWSVQQSDDFESHVVCRCHKSNKWFFSWLTPGILTNLHTFCVSRHRKWVPILWFQALPGTHLPTYWEDWPAAGDQPLAAEADLQPAEGQHDGKDQRNVWLFFYFTFYFF